MTMCDRCGNDDGKPTVNKGTFNFHVEECASKPPATTVEITEREAMLLLLQWVGEGKLSDKPSRLSWLYTQACGGERTLVELWRSTTPPPQPAPKVGETDTHEFRMEYARALKEFAGSDESMFNCGYAYGVIVGKRSLTAAQLQLDRLKARKIDAFTLAKELGPKISLNFNEWKMLARAVEAQLNKERK